MDLSDTDRAKFDKAFCALKRKEYVDVKIRNYYKKKQSYLNQLFEKKLEKIAEENESLGYIYVWNKWRTPKEVTEYLIQQNITPTTLKRQELILTRLLEAENSEFKREQDNKRESSSVKNQRLSNPKKIFEGSKEHSITNDILIKSKVRLNHFYKEKYNRYILNINE